MEDLIEVNDRFYILAGSALHDERSLVLKHGESFGVFNALGDIETSTHPSAGLFTEGMRFLSRLRTRINRRSPLLLSARVSDDNHRLIVDLTNADISDAGTVRLPRGSLHLARTRYLWDGSLHERLTITNFTQHELEVTLSLTFECDFADIFEIRGTECTRRGELLEPDVSGDTVTAAYEGLDGIPRRARILFRPTPDELTDSEALFRAVLAPRERRHCYLTVRCEPTAAGPALDYGEGVRRKRHSDQVLAERFCQVRSNNERLDAWLQRSAADVRMLLTETGGGHYPYAGVPWYSTPFGRDGIITALELLWVNPDIARGVLEYLASVQADREEPARDAEPGKILHERRTDEMSNLGEVPFGRYYGSVDATPLFIVLAGRHFAATGDREFLRTIWPNVQRALEWIDRFGDLDGDGFIEYRARTSEGLVNQGWKDSQDGIFHADGRMPEPPIALCEVQGYVYEAKLQAATMAAALGEEQEAARRAEQARTLKRRFHEAFWLEELGSYALALDGRKQPCAVRSSNAGHCLFSGIADEAAAQRIRDLLFTSDMFSGWGVRTAGAGEALYNPMSYHNGSVWPHDNALIAAGLARYGFRDAALRLFKAIFDASMSVDLHRLPELFCGFARRRGKGPTLYPVACSPQAWSAGAVFMLLGACLGLFVDGVRRQVHIHRPRLPQRVSEVTLRNLRVGEAQLDLLIHREKHDVGVLVLRKDSEVDLVVTK